MSLRALDLIPIIDETSHLLPLAEPWLQRVCDENDEWSIAEVYEGIARGVLEAWVVMAFDPPAIKGAGVTQVSVNKAGVRSLDIVLFSGDGIDDTLALADRFEQDALARGCHRIRITEGRTGWARKLRQLDYRVTRYCLEKVLTHGRQLRFEQHHADHASGDPAVAGGEPAADRGSLEVAVGGRHRA